ncbi:uncharacterized protein B0H64DRAFT_147348 [Chaetomium fimeti]|uniref:NCT transcriptional regulatory complex subunit A n=1 Tax=Chaetomium fimeti TaxID=1854472 RepID=A0AAE0HFQ4_9PEZI|nr:hypothetical protein B0H64DRAFT_147348 [Chaetomium fimeti]
MSGDDTYAPKSPDLSSFHSGPTPPSEPAEPQLFLSQPSQPNFLHLQSPASTSFASAHHPHRQAPQTQQQYQLATPPQAIAHPRPTHNSNTSQPPGFGVGPPSASQHEYYSPRAASFPTPGYSQPNTGYPATQASPPQQHLPPFYQPSYRDSFQYQHYQHHPHQHPHDLIAAQAQAHHPYDYSAAGGAGYEPADAMPPRRAAAAAAAAAVAAQTASDTAGDNGSLSPAASATASAATSVVVAAAAPGAGAGAAAAPPSIEAATVKTKFPTARIKRIMQADEEVGKVAQQTPIAVGKALELFMMALVTKSADVARQRNSKRVSAQMLKQVVEGDDQWDFLRDIVGKVDGDEKGGRGAGQSQGGGRGKAENSDTDEEMGSGGGGEVAAAGVKKKRGGGRKKKGQ